MNIKYLKKQSQTKFRSTQVFLSIALLLTVPVCVLATEHSSEKHKQDFSGHAHWYGKELHGRPTASGELFDKDKLTAAHPSLPLGTHVHVRSVHTGREVIVKVNDRCPVTSKRVIDLSEAAAKQIGIWPYNRSDVECSVLGKHVPEHLKHLQILAQPGDKVHPAQTPFIAMSESASSTSSKSNQQGRKKSATIVATSENEPALTMRVIPPRNLTSEARQVAEQSSTELTTYKDISLMKMPMAGMIDSVAVPKVLQASHKENHTAQNDVQWSVAPIAGLDKSL